MYKFYYTNGYGVTSYIQKSATSLWQTAWHPSIRKWLMRVNLTCVMLLIAFMQVSLASNAQKISLSKKNAPLTEVFKELRKQSGYDFVINKDQIKIAKPVTIMVNGDDLINVLNKCFEDQPFSYSMEDKMIIVVNKKPEQIKINAPPKDVKGRLVDDNGVAMVGASVMIKGTDRRTVTNDNGEFSFTDVDEKAILIISFIGYEVKEISVNGNLENIKMVLFTGKLDEVNVVSTGYQSLPKERATGSFTVVDNKALNRAVSPDIISRLKGITNGLLVDKNVIGGFNIRGKSTIFSEVRPLIVIDNFPFEGDINSINPNDVESVTLLKDAAAASIWGVRAGNGVIVINTKRGKLNQKHNITLNANLTIGAKPDLHYQPQISSTEFIDIEKFLFSKNAFNIPLLSKYTVISPVVALLQKAKLDPSFTAEANRQIDAMRNLDVRDQLDEYFYRNSTRQQYNVNISGGGTTQTYFFSAGYDKNLPNEVNVSSSRISLKGNNTYSFLKDRLKLSSDINLTKSKATNTNASGYTPYLPYEQIADANGNPLAVVQSGGLRALYTDTAGSGRLLDWKFRPLEELNNQNSISNTNTTDYRILLGLDYKIISPLSVSFNYQYYNSSSKGETNFNQQSFFTRNRINTISKINYTTGQVTRPIPIGDIYSPTFLNSTSNYGRAQLNYNQTFAVKHNINAIAGYEVREDQSTSNGYTVYGYLPETGKNAIVDVTTTFPFYNGAGSSQIGNTAFQGGTIARNISYYANASYVYDGRYILSGSYRKDESNLFGVDANQKGVPLWSTGLAWNVHKEKFFALGWLPLLQLKATYGYNGNVNRTLSAYLTAQSAGDNPIYSGNNYYNIINPPNNSLRWERVQNMNVGVDFATRHNRISGSFEYYIKKGIDLIGNSNIAPQTGVSVYTGNSANTFARGVDLQLNSVNINRAFSWLTTFILNYNKDKVTEYKIKPGTNAAIMQRGLVQPVVGYPINSLFGYRWRGLDATGNPQGELNGIISKDYSAISNLTDYAQLDFKGSSVPTLYGAFRNTFSYKNIELSFNISYKFNYYFRRGSYTGNNQNNYNYLQADYAQRWQKAGDELITDVPALVYPLNANRAAFYQLSSILIEKGDHIRLQDVQLNYTISRASGKKVAFDNINIYCYASNLWILWRANNRGLDPDVASGYPAPKTIAFGVKTNF